MICPDVITRIKNLNFKSKILGDFSLAAQSEVCLLPNRFYRGGDKFRNKRFVNIGNDTIESLGLRKMAR